jgi:flavin-binding protein dodecin
MPDNVYKVFGLVGTSEESWEKAAKAAVDRAAQSLRDLRVAEVVEQDLVIEKGKVTAYRTKVKALSSTKAKTDSHVIGTQTLQSRL